MNLEQFIELSNTVKDVDELYELLEKALARMCGYDRVLFSLMTDHPSLGLKAGHGVMRNYPDSWMKHYVEKGYEHIDPVPRFGFRHVGPFIWDSLPLVMDFNPLQQRCMNECREADFYNGAAICLRGVTGELGGIGVASSSQKKPDSEKEAKNKLSLLNVISQHFYVAFCALHEREKFKSSIILTGREVDVLHHMALAKKDDTIACDLGITRHAVDFHVRNILKKFEAPNRLQAVLKAINGGLLSLDSAVFIRKSGTG